MRLSGSIGFFASCVTIMFLGVLNKCSLPTEQSNYLILVSQLSQVIPINIYYP